MDAMAAPVAADRAFPAESSAIMPDGQQPDPIGVQVTGSEEMIELSVLGSMPGVSPALLTALYYIFVTRQQRCARLILVDFSVWRRVNT